MKKLNIKNKEFKLKIKLIILAIFVLLFIALVGFIIYHTLSGNEVLTAFLNKELRLITVKDFFILTVIVLLFKAIID